MTRLGKKERLRRAETESEIGTETKTGTKNGTKNGTKTEAKTGTRTGTKTEAKIKTISETDVPADRLEHEKRLWSDGVAAVAGVDEVGRGCLFGDVVAAAVILPPGLELPDVDDSKKLTATKREELFDLIVREAVAYGIACVDAATIDRINIKQAARLAMKQAMEQMGVQPGHLLVDAERVETDIPQTAIIHGDALSQSIAAASILAKVTRDRKCLEWDLAYPEYGLAGHKGYATKVHREAILQFGPSPLHRRSFLGKLLAEQEQMTLF